MLSALLQGRAEPLWPPLCELDLHSEQVRAAERKDEVAGMLPIHAGAEGAGHRHAVALVAEGFKEQPRPTLPPVAFRAGVQKSSLPGSRGALGPSAS